MRERSEGLATVLLAPPSFSFDRQSKLKMHPPMTQSKDAAESALFARSPTQEREKKQSRVKNTHTHTHNFKNVRVFYNPLALMRHSNWWAGRVISKVPPPSASGPFLLLPPLPPPSLPPNPSAWTRTKSKSFEFFVFLQI